MIKHIIFDFGGVIIKHKAHLMSNIISEMFSVSHEKAKEVWEKEMNTLLTGEISSEQYLQKLKNDLNSSKDLPELLTLWRDLYVKQAENVDWKLLELVEKLKIHYHVYLLTDTIDIHDDYNSTRGIYDKFTRVFRSHKEGVSKLSDDAFLRVLHAIKAKPQECIFIDDLGSNIQRASRLGIKSILYTNREKLEQELPLLIDKD